MYLILSLLIVVIFLWAIDRFWLRGGRQPEYQEPDNSDIRQHFASQPESAAALQAVKHSVQEMTGKIAGKLAHKDIKAARDIVNSLSEGRNYESDFIPADANGVAAEWVMAKHANTGRRLLYIHGGGFKFGSPKSHRTMTSNFAQLTGCAVLSIDYRMLPEHRFKDAVEDCRTAYGWLLENGPHGPSPAEKVFVAGDSAGGNLTLSLIAWIRDQKIRRPDAVVAMSPLTDATLSGASVRSNEASDVMLKRLIAPANRIPNIIRPWALALVSRTRPARPVASPLFGDLSDLPPTLLQASEVEMLLDDSRRYFSKACAAGSPVKLQTWAEMVHVWQLFDPELPQARQAWQEISQFIKQHASLQPHPNETK